MSSEDQLRDLGNELGAAIGPIAALLFFGGLFAAIAIWRFDWEEPHG